MRRSMLAAVIGAALFGCGGSATEQLCKDSATARCDKLFECFTSDTDRTALHLGANANDCTAMLKAECDPVTDGGLSAAQCEKPKLYDTAAAQQCIDQFTALKCDAVRMGSFPSTCSNVCK